jgi:hypothetical protein
VAITAPVVKKNKKTKKLFALLASAVCVGVEIFTLEL